MSEPDLERRVRRRRRRGTALFCIAVVGVAVALASVAAAFVVRQRTDDVNERAQPIDRQIRELDAQEAHAVRRLRTLRDEADATKQALADLFAAEQAQVDASNHAVDVANQAVEAYNNARAASIAAAFQGAGDAALADLEQRTAVVTGAAETARRVMTELQQATSG
jgi:hypothetical protein